MVEIARHWSDSRAVSEHDDRLPAFLHNPLLVDLVGAGSNVVVQVLDMRRFKSIYASPNVFDVCGYTADEINRAGVVQFLRNLSLRELFLHVKNARLMSKVKRGLAPRAHFQSALINSGMRTKDRRHLRVVSQNYTVEWDDSGRETFALLLWRDATHLFKTTNVAWRHQWRTDDGKSVVWTYQPERRRFLEQDFFSAREREVLVLVERGLSSKEIGEALDISVSTVENHRKNAIARLQVKSTEGLIEVCKWLKIL